MRHIFESALFETERGGMFHPTIVMQWLFINHWICELHKKKAVDPMKITVFPMDPRVDKQPSYCNGYAVYVSERGVKKEHMIGDWWLSMMTVLALEAKRTILSLHGSMAEQFS